MRSAKVYVQTIYFQITALSVKLCAFFILLNDFHLKIAAATYYPEFQEYYQIRVEVSKTNYLSIQFLCLKKSKIIFDKKQSLFAKDTAIRRSFYGRFLCPARLFQSAIGRKASALHCSYAFLLIFQILVIV